MAELDDIETAVRRGIDRHGRTLIVMGKKTSREDTLDRLRSCAATLSVALIVWEDTKLRIKGQHVFVAALSEVPTGDRRVDGSRMISARRFHEADPNRRWLLPAGRR